MVLEVFVLLASRLTSQSAATESEPLIASGRSDRDLISRAAVGPATWSKTREFSGREAERPPLPSG